MSKMEDEMTAFQIEERDNVATALKVLEPGTVRLLGDSREKKLSVREEIPAGHKVALTDIAAGENIVKYGVVIGRATKDIRQGTWVHLHVMCSIYDQRSSHLDVHTGAPKDTRYE